MKSLASLCLLLSAGAAAAQEPPPGDGPRGSSQLAAGETRYDAVGLASIGASGGVSAVSSALPAGSYAEVTALDSGKTIVVSIVAGDVGAGRVAALSPAAATALGLTGEASAVRVRKVVPTPQDVVQLQNGQPASYRADAPPALLGALRKMLPAIGAGTTPSKQQQPTPPKPGASGAKTVKAPAPPRAASPSPPAPKPVAATPPRITSGYVVQVAALSSAARASVVARAVGGTVIAGPPIWRVRLGPFADAAAATRARAEAARTGYPGGQITRIP